MLIKLDTFRLDNNYHGPAETTLRSTWQIVRMESYAKMWTLYIYRADGSTIGLTVAFPRWRGPWPKGSSEPRRTEDTTNGR